jgi:hypothetical protein
MFCPRAHCLSENRSRRLSVLRSAVKTAGKRRLPLFRKKLRRFPALASEARS